jgi:tRNA uridine 5-carbamoylmethylation protein Kti12
VTENSSDIDDKITSDVKSAAGELKETTKDVLSSGINNVKDKVVELKNNLERVSRLRKTTPPEI